MFRVIPPHARSNPFVALLENEARAACSREPSEPAADAVFAASPRRNMITSPLSHDAANRRR